MVGYSIGVLLFSVLAFTLAQDQCNTEYELRLNTVNGLFDSNSGAGRVEICICTSNDTCYWQTVIADSGSIPQPLSLKNSIVVCRQLGYFDVQSPILQKSLLNSFDTTVEIFRYSYTFTCDGTETSLSDCETQQITGSLSYLNDAFVNCQTGVSRQKVRLTGSDIPNEGVVEYYLSGVWRTICPDSWDDTAANTLCISLGYTSGTAETYPVSGYRGSSISLTSTIQSISCGVGVNTFTVCTHTLDTSCALSDRLAGASCVSDAVDTDGSIRRLSISGASTSYQRVEILYNGLWGTMCDNDWTQNNGEVVCNAMGLELSSIPSTSVSFNSLSSRPIWTLGYNCNGDETSLTSCDAVDTGAIGYVTSDCTHSSDAGIICVAVTEAPTSDESGGGGGLSGGAIAGIVIGILVFLGLLGWFIGFQDRIKKRRAAEAARRRQATASAVILQTVTTTPPATTTQPPPPTTTPAQPPPPAATTKPVSEPPTNPVFSQAPPPAYNEALNHLDVTQPPQYSDEEKKLPYTPQPDFNPAYPTAPPQPDMGYQGYPPPTAGSLPYPSSNPYPPGPVDNYPYPS